MQPAGQARRATIGYLVYNLYTSPLYVKQYEYALSVLNHSTLEFQNEHSQLKLYWIDVFFNSDSELALRKAKIFP